MVPETTRMIQNRAREQADFGRTARQGKRILAYHPSGNVPLGRKTRAILNFSLIVPPTLGRNALCSSQKPASNVSVS
jgi:hypothetical protein